MKKAVIAVIIGVIVLGAAGYGHHKEKLAQEKVTVQNEILLMKQEISGGNIAGANADLDRIMKSNYPLTKVEEGSYKGQIDNIDIKKDCNNSNIASKTEVERADKSAKIIDGNSLGDSSLTTKNIIATYLNIDSIENMDGISEASVNGTIFYKATEGAAPNGNLINLDKKIMPVEIFKGIDGYKFSMRGVNSKINSYFYVSKSGVVYTWDDILNGFKNGTLTANISEGLDKTNTTDLTSFIGEFGPNSGINMYYKWSGKQV